MKRVLLYSAAVWLVLALFVAVVIYPAPDIKHVSRPAFHAVPNPRCFPPGTQGWEDFVGCRDDIRDGVVAT